MIISSYKDAPTEAGLYRITSPTGKVYIGQSINLQQRLQAYFNLYGFLKSQSKIYASLQKHGVQKHIIEVIELCEVALLNERERYHKEQVVSELGWKLTLFCKTDDQSAGPMHPDTIAKMRKAKLGCKHSEETKQKISSANKGGKRDYMVERNKKMFTNRPALNKRAVIQLNTHGTVINEYDSIDRAIQATSINPKCCLSGKCKTAGGFIWKYKDSFVS